MDLNILVEAKNLKNGDIKDCLKRAYEFGFECVAINTVIDSSILSGKNIEIPPPKSVTFDVNRNFKIVNRLTAVIEDGVHAHHLMKCPVTKKYDLLALQTVGEKMLQHVCSSVDADIISLNLAEDMGYSLKRTYIGQAIEKNVCFEIQYAPCLRNQASKRYVIRNAQILADVAKRKNIIISSGAIKPLEIRSVEDVINLGLLFGFGRNQANSALRETGRLILSHAGTRRKTGCGFVSVTGICRLPKQQGWLVKACKVPNLSDKASADTTAKRAVEASDADEHLSKKAKLCEA